MIGALVFALVINASEGLLGALLSNQIHLILEEGLVRRVMTQLDVLVLNVLLDLLLHCGVFESGIQLHV